jgi:hypothetical protein
VPQTATVGIVGGFMEDGAIGTPEEPAVFGQAGRRQSSLSTLFVEPDSTRLARGDTKSSSALQPESGGSRGNAASHPFPSP